MTIEERVALIEQRNKSVEADKAWETSVVRKMFVAVCTYVFMGIFLSLIQVAKPWVNALVPTCGFLLSTLTLPFIKRWWIGRRSTNDNKT